MTRHESGRKGGTSSGEARTLAAVGRARSRALEALDGVDPSLQAQLSTLVRDGRLDRWLQTLERINYRRGYGVRDEAARREVATAERAELVTTARDRFIDVERSA